MAPDMVMGMAATAVMATGISVTAVTADMVMAMEKTMPARRNTANCMASYITAS